MMIALILLLALILRLVNLNQSLWLDEAVQAITAQNSLSYLFQEITGDFHPPLYFFLMHFWVRIFGSSEIALRLPSVLFGVGTVFVLYKLAMHVHSRFVTVLVSLFFATAPFHIYYSQEARMYSMACFFAALSMFYFSRISNLKSPTSAQATAGKQNSKPKLKVENFHPDIILYFISTSLLLYSDYYGFLVLLAQMIFLLIQRKYKFLLICLFAYLLIFLPWLPMFIKQIKTGMLATQLLPGWGKLVNVSFIKAIPLTLIKFAIGRITIFDKTMYGVISLGLLGLLGGLGYKIYKYYKNYKEKERSFLEIISLWFFVPLIVSWLASLFVPNFQPFRLLLILPAFYLLLAMGVEGLKGNRWVRRFAIAIFLVINLSSLSVYYFNPYFYREDWKGLVGYLQKQKSSTVILPSSASNWPIRYYDLVGKVKLQEGIVGIGEIKEMGEIREDKIYFIRYLVPLFDPSEKILQKLDKEGYTKTREVNFNQIPVWEYQKIINY